MRELIVFGALALFVSSTLGIRRCPDGWYSPNSMGISTSCFLFYEFGSSPPKFPYSHARAYCQDHGGNLATFKTADEATQMADWLKSLAAPSAGQKPGKYILGYAFTKENVATYEGISADFNVLKSSTAYDGAPTTVSIDQILILNGAKILTDMLWTILDAPTTDTEIIGAVCMKPKDQAVCSKMNKPYLSSFGGRRIPMRPYSRYWLMTAKEGDISVWTDTAGIDGPSDESPPDMYMIGPRPGPFINYVEFSYNVSTTDKRKYAIFRVAKGTWVFRKYSPTGGMVTNQILDISAIPIMGTTPKILDPLGATDSLTVSLVYGGGQYDRTAVLISLPTYSFFFDGVDIQVFRSKDKFDNSERGLCDTSSKGQSNPFYNKFVIKDDPNKTTNIYTFAKGQLRTPQFAITAGRPLTCTSHALFESAIRECSALIHPGGNLAFAAGNVGCFLTATDGENATNKAYSDQAGNTVYQACIESVCAHGPSAKCYYVDKLLNKIVKTTCPTMNGAGVNTTLQEARGSVGCLDTSNLTITTTNAQGSCKAKGGAFSNGACYTMKPTAMTMISAQVACNKYISVQVSLTTHFNGRSTIFRLGSQLPAPQTPDNETQIAGVLSKAAITSAWLGVMVGYSKDTLHAVPFKKAVATDEATPIYSRSKKLPDEGDNQCVSMTASAGDQLVIGSCTETAEPSAVCVSTVSDEDCTQECMFPKQCDDAGKVCSDPCAATSFEVNGLCSTNLLA